MPTATDASVRAPCPAAPSFVDRETAALAVEHQLPAIEAALRDEGISGLGVLHVVVLDPAVVPGDGTFDQALLYERSIGLPRERWDADYAAYARSKARLSWLHRGDSRRLVYCEPHRLGSADALVWGGVWLDGIVVAASGCQPIWDEAFSLAIAGLVRTLAWQRAEAARHAG